MTRINRPPGHERLPDWWERMDEPVAQQPAPEVNVTDPHPDKLLYGPRGDVIARVSTRNPLGFGRPR